MTAIDESMYRLTVEQRNSAWQEAEAWKQRYETLSKFLVDQASLMANPMIKPVMLADKESYEAGRIKGAADEREACAKVCDDLPTPERMSLDNEALWELATLDCAEAIRARGQA